MTVLRDGNDRSHSRLVGYLCKYSRYEMSNAGGEDEGDKRNRTAAFDPTKRPDYEKIILGLRRRLSAMMSERNANHRDLRALQAELEATRQELRMRWTDDAVIAEEGTPAETQDRWEAFCLEMDQRDAREESAAATQQFVPTEDEVPFRGGHMAARRSDGTILSEQEMTDRRRRFVSPASATQVLAAAPPELPAPLEQHATRPRRTRQDFSTSLPEPPAKTGHSQRYRDEDHEENDTSE